MLIQEYETKKIKGENCIQLFIDRLLPFITYLQSKLATRKKKNIWVYKKSTYYINIFDENRGYATGLIAFDYKRKKFSVNHDYNNTCQASLPKGYFKVCLAAVHNYERKEIKKCEIEECPANTYKLEQCVICLDNKPNILYKPCMHYCICLQCEKKGKFENCPYCREIIEESILIKS